MKKRPRKLKYLLMVKSSKANNKAKGMKIRLRFIGIRKTGPPIVTLFGRMPTRREAINALFLLYSFATKM